MLVTLCVSHESGGYAYRGTVHPASARNRQPFAVLAIAEAEGFERGRPLDWHFNTTEQIDAAIAELFALRSQFAPLFAQAAPETDPACDVDNAYVELGEPVA